MHIGTAEVLLLSLLNLELEGDKQLASHFSRFNHGGKAVVPTEQEAEWAPTSSLYKLEKRKITCPLLSIAPCIITNLTTLPWLHHNCNFLTL